MPTRYLQADVVPSTRKDDTPPPVAKEINTASPFLPRHLLHIHGPPDPTLACKWRRLQFQQPRSLPSYCSSGNSVIQEAVKCYVVNPQATSQ
ncbi:predicted protein [Lichtheimia corymbifera JMRC:FSU:9682]|uniref:Uncharacterized protein n=1 Tax=Lichtheimia corymbifera JMRC:FSU:9682 TaxID=1263082 RepID=A0A068S7A7_9FUNG|nr:predicted protein [Lichtheimia corymbifera JMRC:FSU:9682]